MREQERRFPGLQIGEDMRQQRREWRMQRIGWPILYILLLAIIAGLLGKGPLSSTKLGAPGDALQMQYERFLRHRSPDKLAVSVQAASQTVQIMLDNTYARNLEIERITPTPAKVISGEDAMIFVFHVRPGTTMHAQFYFQPEKIGSLKGWIALEGHPRQPFKQFVYP